MRPHRSLPLALVLILAAPSGVRAGEDPAPAGATDLARALDRAEGARREGRYADAEALYRSLLEREGEGGPAGARAGLARVLRETGRVADALLEAAAAAEGAPEDPEVLVLYGELLHDAGRLEDAERTLGRAVAARPRRPLARAALGDLLRATGRRKQALALFEEANELWAARASDAPEDLTAVARARFAIYEMDREVQVRLVATADILAAPIRTGFAPASVLLAEAYAKNSQTEKVPNALRAVLDRNPRHPDALVAAARAKEARFESAESAELAKRALETDPTHPGAVEILALQRYGDGDREGAARLLDPALRARPRHRVLLALDAIPAYLRGDEKGFEAAMGRVLEVDPTFGRGFELVARILEDQRRFREAVAMARRAVAVDPGDADAWFALARNLLNLGEEKEAREALDRSDAADPWKDIFRENFRTVLEELDGYVSHRTERFELLLHPEENAALRGLYAEALDRSYAEFRDRYGFEPELPLLVEVFRNARSFSARTLGVPGFGAVGACFGKVITLDSPSALPPGANCWRATVHHEMAHVFHLQRTRGRVPRWFTEGLAVHEESRAHASWIRNMYRELVSAMANGEVRGLLEIDGAFRTDVAWAYFQSGLMCAWIEREFGWPKVLEMLRLYGEGLPNAKAVEGALGLSPEAFDAGFLSYCGRITEGWRVRPAWSDGKLEEFRSRSARDARDAEAHLRFAEACLQRNRILDAGAALARARALDPEDPVLTELRGLVALRSAAKDRGVELLREALAKGRDHFDLRMGLGARAEEGGRAEEAVEHYRRAKLWFPMASGDGDPRRRLEKIYTGLGRTDEAVRELEERVALSETELEGRLRLAGIREDRGEFAGAATVLREALDIMPIPGRDGRGRPSTYPAAEVHARLGRALVRTDRPGPAADAFALAVTVGRTLEPRLPKEAVAALLVEEAKAARKAGRAFEARAALEDALRTDPGNAEAAELLRDPAK